MERHGGVVYSIVGDTGMSTAKILSTASSTPEEIASAIEEEILGSAFGTFTDTTFRHVAGFGTVPQMEHDRIFNEVILAPMTLAMLTLEAPDLRVDEQKKTRYLAVRRILPETHTSLLSRYGIEPPHLVHWDKLAGLRYSEYKADMEKVREAALTVERKAQPVTPKVLAEIGLVIPVQAVAIGAHHHIVRGKTVGRDDLFRYIHSWLSKFYLDIRIPLEGGKITVWQKLHYNLKMASLGSVNLKVRLP
jgi:hypothetical protein